MNRLARRDFLKSGALLGAAALTGDAFASGVMDARPSGNAGPPIVITSANGVQAAGKAMELIQQGSDALDAVIAGVNIVEDDPNDNSVGYGGLPNEDGVVELDAAVMHGPTYRAGAVASIRNIKNPSRVARRAGSNTTSSSTRSTAAVNTAGRRSGAGQSTSSTTVPP